MKKCKMWFSLSLFVTLLAGSQLVHASTDAEKPCIEFLGLLLCSE